jgi:hypothetical protein
VRIEEEELRDGVVGGIVGGVQSRQSPRRTDWERRGVVALVFTAAMVLHDAKWREDAACDICASVLCVVRWR